MQNLWIGEFQLWCNRMDGVFAAAGTQVRSLALHSGLRIQHCCSCGIGCNSSLDPFPGMGTPYALGQPKKKKGLWIWKEDCMCVCVCINVSVHTHTHTHAHVRAHTYTQPPSCFLSSSFFATPSSGPDSIFWSCAIEPTVDMCLVQPSCMAG